MDGRAILNLTTIKYRCLITLKNEDMIQISNFFGALVIRR